MEKSSPTGKTENQKIDEPKFKYSEIEFLEHLNFIDNCRTLDCLAKAIRESLGFDRVIIQNVSPFGVQTPMRHKYVSKGVPQAVLDFVNKNYSNKLDPVAKFILNKGSANWISDMVEERIFIDSGYVKSIQSFLDITGDGICIPSFYKHHWAYGVVCFGKEKTECGELLLFQTQTLLNRAHTRYIILRDLLQKKVKLTHREVEVIELISLGKTNNEIAIILSIKASTVASYVKSIYLKLDAGDRVTATLKAMSLDLIS